LDENDRQDKRIYWEAQAFSTQDKAELETFELNFWK
jgi:hypothetical protein